jgi:HlyD family secretion protein
MPSAWLKNGVYALLGVTVIGGFAFALREKPVLIDTAEIVEAPMKVSVLQEGKTRVRDVYTVSSPIAGHLARTVLEEGDPVKANATVIAAIHPLDPPLIDDRTLAELKAAVEGAEAAVTMAETQYESASVNLSLSERELKRSEDLARTSVISESTLLKARTDLKTKLAAVAEARAAIDLRKAELATARAKLMQPNDSAAPGGRTCCVNVTAPVDGVVLAVFAKSEQPVAVGAKIAEIGDPAKLEIVVDLLSSDAVKLGPGTEARILDWGGEPLNASVRRIDPAAFTKVSALGIEEQRVNAILDLGTTDPRLGHGFRVYAELTVWQSPGALQIPIGALFRNGRDWSAFAVRDGRAEEMRLSIGHMNDETAEVLAGLSAGDVVILHPSDVIAEGTLVSQR